MKKFLVWLVFLIQPILYAQNIQVIDKITRQPIPGAVVYSKNPSRAVITNAKGQALISVFGNTDTLFVKCFSYLPFTVAYDVLKVWNYRIELVESNIHLDEVVVATSRWEEEEKESAVRVEKLNMKEMALQNPQTAADLLGAGSNVFIQKSQQAGGSPMIRGFATNRVMLVVDGVRMNNAIFRSGNVQNVISLDANAMESAEVLFGPGSVMYGSDAIGGVMDFHTKKPFFADSSGRLTVKANALTRYATANNENTGHIDLSVGLKKIAFITSFTYAKYDDLVAGTNDGDSAFLRPFYQVVREDKDTQLVNVNPSLQVHSGYTQINFMQKVSYKPTESWKLDYAFHFSESGNAPRYDRLISDVNNDRALDFSEWYYGPQVWKMHRFAVKYNNKTKLFDNVRLVTAYQQFEESRHDRRFNATGSLTSGNARIRRQFEFVNAYSANLDLDKRLGEGTMLFYGAEYVLNQVKSEAYRQNVYTNQAVIINPRYPNGSTWQSVGVYAHLKHKLNKQWLINGGIRYSSYQINAKFDTTLFKYPLTSATINNGALNGSAGLVFTPVKNAQLYMNASTGFRSPNVDDIGKVFDSQPGSVVVPNNRLKPEYAYNTELGGAFIFLKRIKADFAIFYTYLKDALVRRPYLLDGKDSIIYNGVLSQVYALQNAKHAHVYGFQISIEVYLGHGFSVRNNITIQRGNEFNNDSARYFPLSHAMPLYGNSHVLYTAKRVRADFYVNYNGRVDYEMLPLTERLEPYLYARDTDRKPYVPAWYTLNFKLAYFINKFVSVNAGIENITDRLYRPFGSGISAPGRNYIIALRGQF